MVNGYIWLMRGTPLMLQMLFIYFALPFVPVIGVRLPDFPAAIVAFVLNYAAYFAEIFRAGIQSIERGQYEAAKVLGLSYGQTMRRIVLPQVVKRILPPMSNETITLVKDTSLIYVLAMNDLLRAARGNRAARLHDHALRRRGGLLPADDTAAHLGLPLPGEATCRLRRMSWRTSPR
jgi:polar amino acid transport system permease protein